MKWLLQMMCVLMLNSCTAQETKQSETASAQVGIVNHTGNYIYSATVNGSGGGTMSAWGAGVANICCASIPRVWYPAMKVRVEWDMPEGRKHVIKEKVVAGYGKQHPIPPPIYPGYSSAHPIPHPIKPDGFAGK